MKKKLFYIILLACSISFLGFTADMNKTSLKVEKPSRLQYCMGMMLSCQVIQACWTDYDTEPPTDAVLRIWDYWNGVLCE